jgi:tRNA (cytidine/uridine-2'-O-)-methyltransferase
MVRRTGLGKAESDAIRPVLLAPLPGECKGDFTLAVKPMRIALYQPDIPQNTGTILRLCACLGIEAHIIEPAGFPTTDRAFRRAGMDYLDAVALVRHTSWQAFEAWRREQGHRLTLFTTSATVSYLDYRFGADDVLLFGRESAGVPAEVHEAADARLLIPMRPGLRSLNVAVAAAMAAGEALRQIGNMKP